MMFNTYKHYTYIAADWEHDKEVVDKLYEWNKSTLSPVNFANAHEITQARDESLKCSIKESLRKRLIQSHKFILIVGKHTKFLTAGGCQFCDSYNSYTQYCARGYSRDNRSFIKYECDKAMEMMLDILVLYNSSQVDHSLCPDGILNYRDAWHVPFYRFRTPLYFGSTSGLGVLGTLVSKQKVYNQQEIINFLAR